MKRLALVAVAVLAVAACAKKDEAAMDTTMPAAAPAPAMTTPDTSMKMTDTSMKADTTKKDTLPPK
jgi:hypothetical protein